MKLSKIYKDKKKGVHVCYAGSHYGAPEDSKVDTDKRAELGPVADDETGKAHLAVKQGDTSESWPLIGSYTGAKATKEEPAPKSKKAPKAEKPAAVQPAAATPAKKKDKKGSAPRKRSQVAWKEPTAEQQEAVIERIREAGGDEALPTLKAAWVNWTSSRNLPLFQGLNFLSDETNERVQALGRELMTEFGSSKKPKDDDGEAPAATEEEAKPS